MGSVSVSSCRCCMFVSCVHPVAVLNAAFCMCLVCILWQFSMLRSACVLCASCGSSQCCVLHHTFRAHRVQSPHGHTMNTLNIVLSSVVNGFL